MVPVVQHSQAYECAPRLGIRMGRALARQIRKEEQPLAAGGRLGSCAGQQIIGVLPAACRRRAFRLPQAVAQPAEGAARGKHDPHQMPPSGDSMAEGVQTALCFGSKPVRMGEYHTRGSRRDGDDSRLNHPAADSLGSLIPPAADYRRSGLQTGLPGRGSGDRAGYIRRFRAARQPLGRYVEGAEHFIRPAPPAHVQQRCS